MTEAQEAIMARDLFTKAQDWAYIAAHAEDREAATMAILVQALILATPELSAERRSGLFLGEEE